VRASPGAASVPSAGPLRRFGPALRFGAVAGLLAALVVAAVLGGDEDGGQAGGPGGAATAAGRTSIAGALGLSAPDVGHRVVRVAVADHPHRRRAASADVSKRHRAHGRPERPVYYVPGNAVALTFDDGPDPRWTPQVLDLLRANHVHATFCVIGRQASAYPYLVRRIVAEGHTLCNHSWDHDEHLPRATPAHLRAEMALATRAIVAASGGVRPTLFRAPGGNWSPAVLAEARAQGMRPIAWSVDPRDWSRPGVPYIVRAVLAAGPGDVILLHDGGGTRVQTVSALRQVLPVLRGRGLAFVVP
jgi:peptidoglycan-N-acetylglucosamine deacetylase